ncbi:MAG: VWA domain-containing protein [Phycisphaeraceae bacterium]|nr:MAG: VWA domain-containing protein [Phycisphaeraceae bacterium]
MKFSYREFDGASGRFLSPDDLFPHPALIEFIIEHGQDALDALPQMNEQIQEMLRELIEAGLLEEGEGGELRMTPRMLKGMQHQALLEIFREMKPGVKEGHPVHDPGRGGERTDGTRPYQFGDPVSELALHETMRNAIRRSAETAGAPATLPLQLRDSDFELHNVESQTDSALCVLIDLSGSMRRYGRHVAAKKVALGLKALVRERFPADTIDFIGFASTAERLREDELPLVMPKPITTRDWEVRVRIPLERADETHPHLTNLQHGLRLARRTLAQRSAANKQVFIITDGQPTARLSDHAGGTTLHLDYPPGEETMSATLREALSLAQSGVRFSSFALIEEYHSMDWVGFVDQMTRLVRGVAFYCTAGDLGSAIVESYLSGKRQRKTLG